MEQIQFVVPNLLGLGLWTTGVSRVIHHPSFRAFPWRLCHYPRTAIVALTLTALSAEAHAIIPADGITCNVADAITAANTDTTVGGCPAGSSADTIVLGYDVTLTTVDNDIDGANGLPSGSSGAGGALYNLGTLTLTSSTISGNSANGTAVVENDVVADGNALGGGIYNAGTLTLASSTIAGNSAESQGNTFSGASGGGISSNGTLTLLNSTVAGNSATGNLIPEEPLFGGGGISSAGTLTLTHSTVSGNSTDGFIGGLFTLIEGSTTTLTNSLIGNSTSGDCGSFGGTVTTTGVNLIEDGSCGSNFPAGTNPKLGPLADNGGPILTHALLEGSPAIDAIALGVGGCGTDIKTDQRGVSRPQPTGGNCDIGSFERIQAPPLSIAPILDFFDQAMKDGELKGAGPGKSARHRLKALRNMLLAAGDHIEQDKVKAACGQLAAAHKRIDTDGKLKPNEFITGSAAPTLALMIQDLQQTLGCKKQVK